MTKRLWVVLWCVLVSLGACEKAKSSNEGSAKGERLGPAAEKPAPGASVGAPETKEELYDKPVERRLFTDRIEASSFLWTNWNRFQENYHPNYIVDGDPKTAWVEGADKSGAGEWVRIYVSPVTGATVLRMRVRNGYHKSKSLFEKNARIKDVDVVVLPSGDVHKATLADSMGWQEIKLDIKEQRLQGIELRVQSVFEGKKYTDLCVSDVEIFVTGLTKENAAFEKSKLGKVLAWKKERLKAAKIFQSEASKSLPIASGYRVDERGGRQTIEGYGEPGVVLDEVVKKLPEQKDNVKRAKASLAGKFKDWVAVKVTTNAPSLLPDVDGLRQARQSDLTYGTRDFLLLATRTFTVVDSSKLTVFDIKSDARPGGEHHGCKEGDSWFWRPPKKDNDGPVPRELLLALCVVESEREGRSTYAVDMLLEFAGDGKLAWVVGPTGYSEGMAVTHYRWQEQEGGARIVGGLRMGMSGDATTLALAGEKASD